MNKEIYLDVASTAPVRYFAKDYYVLGNSNSQHSLGLQANQALNEARQRIMDCLGVKSGKVLVGGTASQLVDNLMWRIRQAKAMSTIFCSNYEHDCLYRWADDVINKIPNGWISKGDLVCWMMANNITGTIFPVDQIGKMCRDVGAYYVMDAVAAISHYPISNDLESFCDCLVTSAHKYGGPQGTGCMWVSDRFAKFLELSDDSHEEYGLISGTPNVPGAIALSYAVEHAVDNIKSKQEKWAYLLEYLKVSLYSLGIEADIFDVYGKRTYAINAITFPGINADALTNFLSSRGIYISPGHSVCSNDTAEATRVLEAFGLTKEQASQTVRVSFSEDTSQEDIDTFVQGVKEFKNLFI